MASSLAIHFAKLGHQSVVLTPEKNVVEPPGVTVFSTNSLAQVLREVRRAHGIVVHQDSLGIAWPVFLAKTRPILVAHVHFQKRRGVARLLSIALLRFCNLKAVSHSLKQDIYNDFFLKCDVIPNPYDDSLFIRSEASHRDIDFCFIGRLGIHKRCDMFAEALISLRASGNSFKAAIVGDGPERSHVANILRQNHLNDSVDFVGVANPTSVASYLQRSRCVVIPSGYEPFGIVALEARACGCHVIASNAGGLPEAAGPRALIVPTNDVHALSQAMKSMLFHRPLNCDDEDVLLRNHEQLVVAKHYLSCFGEAAISNLK